MSSSKQNLENVKRKTSRRSFGHVKFTGNIGKRSQPKHTERETQETKGGASFKNVEIAVADLSKDKEYHLEKEPCQLAISRLLIVKVEARLKRIK